MNREQRIKTAEETLAVLAEGSYQNPANQRIEVGSLVEKEQDVLQNNLLTWLFWQVQNLKVNPGEFGKAAALSEASISLQRNQNKKLVLQSLFMKI